MPGIGEYRDRVTLLRRELADADDFGERAETWPEPEEEGSADYWTRVEQPAGDETGGAVPVESGRSLRVRFRSAVTLEPVDRFRVKATDDVYAVAGAWRERNESGGWQTVCDAAFVENAPPPPPPPEFYLRDTFTDTNGTSLAAHTMDVGAGWTVHAGTWDVQSGAARDSSALNGLVSAEAGAADGTASLTLAEAAAANGGIVFRLQDANNYWLWTAAGTLYEVNAGAFTVRASAFHSPVAGDVIGVTTAGEDIQCLMNGVAVVEYSSAFLAAATRWGARCNADPADRFDDFEVRP